MTMGLINDFDFKGYLTDNTKNYEGQYSDQIRLLPEIYDLVKYAKNYLLSLIHI